MKRGTHRWEAEHGYRSHNTLKLVCSLTQINVRIINQIFKKTGYDYENWEKYWNKSKKKKWKETKWETKVISNIRQSKKHIKNVDDKESKYIHVFYRYI